MTKRREIEVKILCHECRYETAKRLDYLVRRVRSGKFLFFCSRKCADGNHAKAMAGSGNPNYEGTFRGRTMAELSPEERSERGARISATMLRKETSKGERNGRWKGGLRGVVCEICGTPTQVRPYVGQLIDAGHRVPCCSTDCARIYGQTRVKKSGTSIEIKMAAELLKRGVAFEEQRVLGNKFILDFFLPEHGIVIECDGDYWHTKPDVEKRDRSKNAYIAACGLKLFRFWEREINESVAACVDIVLAEINAREVAA